MFKPSGKNLKKKQKIIIQYLYRKSYPIIQHVVKCGENHNKDLSIVGQKFQKNKRENERTTMKPKPHKHECGLMHLRAKSMRRRLLALAVGVDDEIGVGF